MINSNFISSMIKFEREVIVVGKNEIVMEGLKTIINKEQPKIALITFLKSCSEVTELIKKNSRKFDILIIDAEYPEYIEPGFIKQLRLFNSGIKFIFLLWGYDKNNLLKIMKLDPAGIIYRPAGCNELITTLKIIYSGGKYFSPAILTDILLNTGRGEERIKKLALLSAREVEILNFISNGLTSKQIAEKLYLSPFTIENHRKKILKKLGVKNTIELVKLSMLNGS